MKNGFIREAEWKLYHAIYAWIFLLSPKRVATTVKYSLEEKVNKSTITIILLQNQFGLSSGFR